MALCSLFPKVEQRFACAHSLRFCLFKSMTNNLAKTLQRDSLTEKKCSNCWWKSFGLNQTIFLDWILWDEVF